MLKVLINAYACSPGMGSEPGMAWNWVSNLAKFCELYIITEGEFRDKIEEVVPTLEQGKNMHFYYNPVSDEIRKMCWNQGDWRFYKYYKQWQWKTYQIAKEIVASHHIDVLHQLNMIGFREPGYLWEIDGIPFVWGPIGGLKQFPLAYLNNAGWKEKLFNRVKNLINILQIKYDRRVSSALHKASILVSSIPDSYRAIKKYQHIESYIIPETGCFLSDDLPLERFEQKEFHIMWVGKFDFRKQLPIAIKTLKESANKNIIMDIYGTGNDQQIALNKKLVKDLGIENQIVWHGNQSNSAVIKAMKKAQLFFFTSVNEDTSTVVLEAISSRLPVLCFNACGFGAVVDNTVGRKIELSNPDRSVKEFAEILNYLEKNRDLLKEMSLNCKKKQEELSWDNKAKQMVELYKKAISKNEEILYIPIFYG